MKEASVCVCRRGGEEVACLLNHTLYHRSIHLPIHQFLLHLFLVGGSGSKDSPRALTPSHTYVDTHLRDVSLPTCLFPSFPLAVASTHTCSFAVPALSHSLSVSPPLLVLYVPPTPRVTAAGEERKMLRPTKVEEKTVERVKGSESWSVLAAHRCLHPP